MPSEILYCARCGAPVDADFIDPATGLCDGCFVGRDTCPHCGGPRAGPWGACANPRCRHHHIGPDRIEAAP